MPGENLDLSSDAGNHGESEAGQVGRKFVGVRFACCEIYSRVYINREGTAYVGHCPRCMHRIQLNIGPGGTNSRFFTAY